MKNILSFLLFLPVSLYANEEIVSFPVACYKDVKLVSRVISQYGEKAFVKGTSTRLTEQDVPFKNEVVMFVNPETKSWTLVEITKDRDFCIIGAGDNLIPAK